jgi:hypothetical protein
MQTGTDIPAEHAATPDISGTARGNFRNTKISYIAGSRSINSALIIVDIYPGFQSDPNNVRPSKSPQPIQDHV